MNSNKTFTKTVTVVSFCAFIALNMAPYRYGCLPMYSVIDCRQCYYSEERLKLVIRKHQVSISDPRNSFKHDMYHHFLQCLEFILPRSNHCKYDWSERFYNVDLLRNMCVCR